MQKKLSKIPFSGEFGISPLTRYKESLFVGYRYAVGELHDDLHTGAGGQPRLLPFLRRCHSRRSDKGPADYLHRRQLPAAVCADEYIQSL